MQLLSVKACMLAKMIKSSSPLVNSRQLLRLNSTVSSLSSLEQRPPFEPCECSQPSNRNFLALWIMVNTACKKEGELLWAIASKKNFINLHSAAFVTIFTCNLVHAYKFRLIPKTS